MIRSAKGGAVRSGRKGAMNSVAAILQLAQIQFEQFSQAAPTPIYLSAGNQLFGTFTDLSRFRDCTPDYRGWHAHHVVETHDLRRLGIATQSPVRELQLCVLLPEAAHIGRINSVLRREVPIGRTWSAHTLLAAYAEAYNLIGDYCGGGERQVCAELVAIVRATFKAHSVI